MIFEYFIHSINNNSYIYIIKHHNNTLVLDIDIIKKFPDYIFIDNSYNNLKWQYYVVSSGTKNRGDIEEIDISMFKGSYPRHIVYNKDEYLVARQYQYDKYLYLINKHNDNRRLFVFIYKYLIIYYKNEHKKKSLKIYKETIV
tara:strand:+ start:200 stop:628 length:429 start_codon:yes stop_codon:yes gene_type:complete